MSVEDYIWSKDVEAVENIINGEKDPFGLDEVESHYDKYARKIKPPPGQQGRREEYVDGNAMFKEEKEEYMNIRNKVFYEPEWPKDELKQMLLEEAMYDQTEPDADTKRKLQQSRWLETLTDKEKYHLPSILDNTADKCFGKMYNKRQN